VSLESSLTDGISTDISLKYFQVANENNIILQVAAIENNDHYKAAMFIAIFAARPTNPDVAYHLHRLSGEPGVRVIRRIISQTF